MYTEYPEENKIVFDDGFNEELTEELLEIINKYSKVVFPPNYSHSLDEIYYQIIIIGIFTIFKPNESIEILDYRGELTDDIIQRISDYTHLVVSRDFPYSFADLPESILQICYEWKFTIYKNDPESIMILSNTDLDDDLIQIVSKYSNVYFSDSFNKPIVKMPDNVKKVVFRSYFNQSIDILENCTSITHIKFLTDCHFNLPINKLPNSLTHLFLSKKFNQPINLLPNSLLYLQITGEFNQPIDCLPQNLIELCIKCNDFNHPIDNLPNSIKKLTLDCYSFNHPIENLPESLTHLDISLSDNHTLTNLPNGLTHLIITTCEITIDNLPNSLQFLDLKSVSDLTIRNLPDSLTHLGLCKKFNQEIKDYPKSLKYICFGNKYNKPIDNLPDSVEYLQFGTNFNQIIKKYPQNLKKIIFDNKFNKPLDNLPESLEYLCVGRNFSQSLDNLPSNLKVFEFYCQKIKFNYLPNSIEKIIGCKDSIENFQQIQAEYPNIVFQDEHEYKDQDIFMWNNSGEDDDED